MARITINITKNKNDKFTVKCGTSVGGGQEKCKDKSIEEVKNFIGNIIKKLDNDGFIGRK